MRKILLLFTLCLSITSSLAQFGPGIEDPVKWSFSFKKISDTEADLILKAAIEPGWHVYSQFIEEGGPIPTSFKFNKSPDFSLVGKVSETPKAVSAFDPNFSMKIAWHEKQVSFVQRIKLNKPKTEVKGVLEYMVCNDEKCLPPTEVEFNIPVTLPGADSKQALATGVKADSGTARSATPLAEVAGDSVDAPAKKMSSAPVSTIPLDTEKKENSFFEIFILGFLGGLAAFFMPCIYPMIPMTVSFFTKKSGSRSNGIKSAAVYGLSIIVIYVLLGLIVTFIFGPSALNEAASSAFFNLLFFIILVIFGISFLGAFNINLPTSFVNKIDAKSNKSGLAGLFFMAFTLALISFSCTGPIIGYLLVDAVSKGTYLGPAFGMFGFSAALAIPFTLFAVFPAWLKEMPKSGGWMNSIKVSLGFLELALAFKFLSNVDLAYHWGILDRQVFLVIWIIIFGVLAFYLFGKIRLSHDAEIKFLSLPRLFFAMLALGFTIYMIPGLWGAPLKELSGWLPPRTSQSFTFGVAAASSSDSAKPKKYANLFHNELGIDAFFDYEEGLGHAKRVNKPVLIDFTGWSCANCRRMENTVWADPEVLKRLKNDYVLISLYVDDKTELHEDEKYTSKFNGKKIKTIGQKWSDFQASTFGVNSQPYYVIVDIEGKKLVPSEAFNLDVKNYIDFLDKGKAAFLNN